jgi:hypothetical protein
LHLPYYRGCWHGISRCLFPKYRQNFFLGKRCLRPTSLHPSRGIAPSGFRPLRKIPHCCLPEESGPYLSPSVAVRPLRPATDSGLGELLPPQLANQPRAHLQANLLNPFHRKAYGGFYTPPRGRFSRVTHPFATQTYKDLRSTCMC